MERLALKAKSALKDQRDRRVSKVLVAKQVHRVPTERKASWEFPASLAIQVLLETKVTRVLLVSWEESGTKENEVTPGWQASVENKDPGASVALEDGEEKPDFLDRRATLANQDPQDPTVNKAARVLKDLLASLEPQVLQGLTGRMALLDLLENEDHQVSQETKAQ